MAPVDLAPLALFRIAFGLLMLYEVGRYTDPGSKGDWVNRYYVEPQLFFPYVGFEWVQPWSQGGMYLLFAALGILAVFIALGLLYRVSALLFFLAFTHVFLIDQSNYLNHFYLISLISFVMIFLPAHREYSLDCIFRPRLSTSVAPTWTLWLLRIQIGIPYFYGGIAKLNSDWLQGEPMRDWLHARTSFPLIGQYFTDERMVYSFVYGGTLLDLLVVPMLLWKKTRAVALIAAFFFHICNHMLFNLGIFPWFMLVATLIYLEPSTIRKIFFFGSGDARDKLKTTPLLPDLAHFPRWTFGLLAIYLVLQLGLPFRHWLYPGNVSWTEEGHNFSWRMKLRTKHIRRPRFLITDPASKRQWEIDPRDYLTKRQSRKMPRRPDMILHFAHWLEKKWELDGYPDVEVRARVSASLNGRRHQNLVDPKVDLTTKERGLGRTDWILPLTEPLFVTEEES